MVGPPRLVIAAPSSGSGKTTVATGLMAALRARGLRVSPHKVGPDYIDPGYHALASGRPGRNLDPWLQGEELIGPLFLHGAAGCDLAVVEGVMGLFDGRGQTDFASTAHVARLLDAPVVLVVDAARQSRSVAALVHGFATFDPRVRVGGVVLNRVGSDRHEQLCRAALAAAGVPVLGAIHRDDAVSTPSRHLGLVPAAERESEAVAAVDRLAALVARSCDLDALVRLAATAPPLPGPPWSPRPGAPAGQRDGGRLTPTPGPARPLRPGAPDGERDEGRSTPAPDSARLPRSGDLEGERVEERPTAAPHEPDSARSSRSGDPDRERDEGRSTAGPPAPDSARFPRSPSRAGAGELSAASRPHGAAWSSSAAPYAPGPAWSARAGGGRPVVAVAGGRAFTFGYAEHVELVRAAGADVAVFDPLKDEALPEGTGALVIGGGFPEMYAAELAANRPLREQVAGFGGPIAAECAGLLYLCEELDGRRMCGRVPGRASMTGRLALGYRDAVATRDSLLTVAGERFHGHEFHRTAVEAAADPLFRWQDGADGFGDALLTASYLHLHWTATPWLAHRLVASAKAPSGLR
ncbi:cobyrinate a,c-diamide synthase [Sphaerisporangium sp. TRM90804]|uniref:cobyrinate a,c-diamide synthase n=1 Tax=Sphaerisporangium sp. TRM90804 TaxID=3031113 RepID=UPI002446F2EF|nr:cobyrinate a,c-diamide synthase [Sphaerisporangium sp. TRM90804]MDH2424880.1 cobyrinate a,c-diamide synthase [Sphaerisporangium sp. TRM90804]